LPFKEVLTYDFDFDFDLLLVADLVAVFFEVDLVLVAFFFLAVFIKISPPIHELI
jgi:hypothetical protein